MWEVVVHKNVDIKFGSVDFGGIADLVFIVYYTHTTLCVRRVWRYQRGYQNSQIEGLTTQWPKKKTKGQTTIYKTLHRKLKIEQHEPHKKREWTPKGYAVPAQLVA